MATPVFHVYDDSNLEKIQAAVPQEKEIHDVVFIGINPAMSFELCEMIEEFDRNDPENKQAYALRAALRTHFAKRREGENFVDRRKTAA